MGGARPRRAMREGRVTARATPAGAEDIGRFMHLLHDEARRAGVARPTFEIRIPERKGKVISGYFEDPDRAAAAVLARDGAKYPGIYSTINPVEPALIARAANRLVDFARDTTADSHVTRRVWFAIDIDAVRPVGISASDDEHVEAVDRAYSIRAHLVSSGWPAPFIMTSGNGAWLLFRIDMPNEPDVTALVERALAAIAVRFSYAKVKVDTSVTNASRIAKIAGTVARKGDDLPERPHRRARILELPAELGVVSREQLEALAGPAPSPSKREERPSDGARRTFDLRGWITKYAGQYEPGTERPLANGTGGAGGWKVQLDECPYIDEHRGSAFIGQHDDGTIVAGCVAGRCKGKWDWSDLREKLDPSASRPTNRPPPHIDADEPPPRGSNGHGAGGRPQDGDPDAPGAEKEPPPRGSIVWLSTRAIFEPLPPTPWVFRDLLICPGRPSMFAGYGFSGKTLLSQALFVAAASGREAWGHFATGAPVRCRHLDFEQGSHATRKRYQRLLAGMGVDLEELGDRLELAVFPSVYLNSPGAMDAYARASEGCGLVLLDALRGATPGEDENDSKVRVCLDLLARVSEKTGATFVVDHHAGKPKDNHSDPRMVLRGSSSIYDACGSVLVLTGEKNEPRLVRQVKAPAEAEGSAVDDFHLRIEDVAVGDNPAGGVRVVYGGTKETASKSTPPKFEEIKARILELVRETRGLASANAIEARVTVGSRAHRLQAIRELEDERQIAKIGGEYRVAV